MLSDAFVFGRTGQPHSRGHSCFAAKKSTKGQHGDGGALGAQELAPPRRIAGAARLREQAGGDALKRVLLGHGVVFSVLEYVTPHFLFISIDD